jgi:hypothetical protein
VGIAAKVPAVPEGAAIKGMEDRGYGDIGNPLATLPMCLASALV